MTKLESLDLQDETPVALFIEYSRNKIDFSALTTLSVWWFEAGDIGAIGDLIRSAASHLHNIDLRLHNLELFDDEDDGGGRTCTLSH